jgi:ABC transporter substrate binding protein (PQQ-dependent alcohol dehydrogenase system)
MRTRPHGHVVLAAAAVAAIGVAILHSGRAQTQAVPAAQDKDAAPAIPITYITREDPESSRGSLSEPLVADYGWQGARFGVDEINRSGQFLGKRYALDKVSVPADGDLASAAGPALSSGQRLIIADLTAKDLLALAAIPEAKQALILDARTSDDTLRQQDCRANVFHLLPNWAMRADALAQFLAQKHWTRWFLLVGPAPEDQAYAAALRHGAESIGAHIVIEKRYQAGEGAPRIADVTHVPKPYDLLLVVDTNNTFGNSLAFNTWDPRLIAGTQGLTAVAWDSAFREYAARGIQYRFFLSASREMTERDYGSWLAASVIGEAIMRGNVSDAPGVRKFLLSDQFSVPANKGEGLTFRRWDHQLRQPLLLFGPHQLVTMWPQDAGHGGHLATDKLGFDSEHSLCHLGDQP